jgi:hypothetical protein
MILTVPHWESYNEEPFASNDIANTLYWKFRIKRKRLSKKEEKIIKKNPIYAVRYAAEVLKKRWFDAEIYIIESSPSVIKEYAQSVICGRLPDKLHNKMILLAMTGCDIAKSYLRWLDEATNN